jgi:hypothetical protein
MTNNRLEERIEAARRNTDVEFDAEERARMLHRIQSDVTHSERRGTRTTIIAAAAAVLLLAGAWGVWLTADRAAEEHSDVAAVPVVFGPGTTVALDDGSVVEVDDDSEVSVVEQSDELVAVQLREGAADFSVSKNPKRSFVVEAGAVKVRVIGTRFRVARTADAVRVDVDEGIVEVRDGDSQVRLTAGEHFDTNAPENDPLEGAQEHASEHAESLASASIDVARNYADKAASAPADAADTRPRWRKHLDGGDRDRAARALLAGDRVGNDFRSLELAADVLDSMGHHEPAADYLERAAKRGNAAQRARADFRRGNLLLERLGKPADAAAVYSTIADGSSLYAEDALAREVEALSKSGQKARAKARAADYIERYPSGARIDRVMRFGRAK